MTSKDNNKGTLFSELSRRNVFRVAAAYAGISWLLLQVADVLFPALGIPDWSLRFVAALLVLGFPVALFLAWAYELTPEGVKRDGGGSDNGRSKHGFDVLIVAVLLLATGGFALNYFTARQDNSASHKTAVTAPPLTQAAAQENVTVAVLPFVNISADEDQEYFTDGLTEELLGVLSRYQTLRVIGRTSSFQFKGKSEDLRVIGEQLGADYLLEGSVRKFRNSVRVTAQLVAASDGVNLWSDSVTRELNDIFALQQEIAGSVAEALELQILGPLAAGDTSPVDAGAYDLYLKALRSSHLRGEENLREALGYAQQAVAEAPELASGWVVIANVSQTLVMTAAEAPQAGLERARAALQTALELDPQLAEAYDSLGKLRMSFEWDWEGAAAAFERALELDPSSASALSGAGLLAAARGDRSASIRLLRQSQRVDPLALSSLHNLALAQYFARNFAEAERGFREALEFAGASYAIGQANLALTLMAQNEFETALAESEKTAAGPFKLAVQASVLHGLGRAKEADEALQALIDNFGDRLAVPIGGNLAFRGELEQAMDWLDRAYEQHDAQLTWTLVHPMNENLHGHPRYEALLDKLGLR